MKTSIKIATALVFVMVVLSCIAQFASGNFSAGMAYITTAIWVCIAYIHYNRAERYRKWWLELIEKRVSVEGDDLDYITVRLVRKKEDDHG